MPYLGVNIDHVATVRQARRENHPDPIEAAKICMKAGADSIVAHLREDRRHIQDKDIILLRKTLKTKFNMELSLNQEIVNIACRIKPDQATLVPERRQEITTEGGLNVIKYAQQIKKVSQQMQKNGIVVSLFIAPDEKQIQKTKELGIDMIEIHTGHYANAKNSNGRKKELTKIQHATQFAHNLGIIVNAGHGLNYENTADIAKIPNMAELNIGHSIISRSIFVGLEKAVKEMYQLCRG